MIPYLPEGGGISILYWAGAFWDRQLKCQYGLRRQKEGGMAEKKRDGV